MTITFSKRNWLFLTVIGVAVILLWSTMSGINKGKSIAQSQVVSANASALALGLKYFYQDQERYPTALEFGNQTLMLNYFYLFPPVNFVSAACPQSFVYKRPAVDSYSLSFCLSQTAGSYAAGWNTLHN